MSIELLFFRELGDLGSMASVHMSRRQEERALIFYASANW